MLEVEVRAMLPQAYVESLLHDIGRVVGKYLLVPYMIAQV